MKLILFVSLLFSSLLYAGENCHLSDEQELSYECEFRIPIRKKKKLVKRKMQLSDLKSDRFFDGKYFKIVQGVENKAISFDAEKDLVMRAASVYYHLTQARTYFKRQNLENIEHLDDQYTIRIDMTRQYSDAIHFKAPIYNKYNGASTIPPAGDNYIDTIVDPNSGEVLHIEPWKEEIWFYRAKKVKKRTGYSKAVDYFNSREFKNAIGTSLLTQDLVSLTNSITFGQLDSLRLEMHLTSMALSVGLSEFIPQVLRLGALFKAKFQIDTAMIPEIIYHEYAHIALKNHIGLGLVSPLAEGFPNYFAAQFSGLTRLGAKTKGYIKGSPSKNGKGQIKFNFEEEFNKNRSFGSFAFSLIQLIADGLGEQGHEIMIHALNNHMISAKSNLNHDFTRAIYQAIDDIGENKRALKLRALKVFDNIVGF